jgi:hypothetical protein
MLAWPFWTYATKRRDESTALRAVQQIQAAQISVRAAAGGAGYATSLDAFTTPCGADIPLNTAILDHLQRAGYAIVLRARETARQTGTDCRGRPLADDFYVGVQPRSARTAGQRAFAATSHGVFVFFDGVAPLEREMSAGGLATRVEALETFKIP